MIQCLPQRHLGFVPHGQIQRNFHLLPFCRPVTAWFPQPHPPIDTSSRAGRLGNRSVSLRFPMPQGGRSISRRDSQGLLWPHGQMLGLLPSLSPPRCSTILPSRWTRWYLSKPAFPAVLPSVLPGVFPVVGSSFERLLWGSPGLSDLMHRLHFQNGFLLKLAISWSGQCKCLFRWWATLFWHLFH